LKEFDKHLDDQSKKKYLPYRIEFQAKVDRKELGEGFSSVMESRFEFRDESAPFSSLNPAPEPPWDLEEYIGYFQDGRFDQYYTWSAKSIVNYLMPAHTDKEFLFFNPKLVLLTERQRQHLNIKTPWGAGPNPEQVFIITMDSSKVYNAEEFLTYMKMVRLGFEYDVPQLKGFFTEVEIEFERNVSSELDKQIEALQDSGNPEELGYLLNVRDAFLEDLKILMRLMKEKLAQKGIRAYPATKSKYAQAYKLHKKNEKK